MKISAEIIRKEVEEGKKRIEDSVWKTPLEYSTFLSSECGADIWLKLENYQRTGSFKIRGAINKVLTLNGTDRKLVTSSTGNHAVAFIRALEKINLEGVIFVPENISPVKLASLTGSRVRIMKFGDDCVKAEREARRFSEKAGCLYISPYNDLTIVGGQGTVALEIMEQNAGIKLDSVLAPVGGGGLISGIAGYFKSFGSFPEIIGCQPVNSAVMYRSVQAGMILNIPSEPTLADGSAGGIEPGSITFGICRDYVDDFILVSEKEIKEAIRLMLLKHFMLIEGAAALPVAALLKERQRFSGRNAVLVLSGCRLDPDSLRQILI
ncbi:MAG: pyridoxal-phosphate dependent enzyme [Candidatus Krumholzibacteriales bacterium]